MESMQLKWTIAGSGPDFGVDRAIPAAAQLLDFQRRVVEPGQTQFQRIPLA
jgi:hypothetical protein